MKATREVNQARPQAETSVTFARGPQTGNHATISGAVTAPMPGVFISCRAIVSRRPPEGKDWMHEVKFDSYGLQAPVTVNRARSRL